VPGQVVAAELRSQFGLSPGPGGERACAPPYDTHPARMPYLTGRDALVAAQCLLLDGVVPSRVLIAGSLPLRTMDYLCFAVTGIRSLSETSSITYTV
jgi:hypothetical protein